MGSWPTSNVSEMAQTGDSGVVVVRYVGQIEGSTQTPLSITFPRGQKQPDTHCLVQARGASRKFSQVSGQAVPQELKTIPVGQVGGGGLSVEEADVGCTVTLSQCDSCSYMC